MTPSSKDCNPEKRSGLSNSVSPTSQDVTAYPHASDNIANSTSFLHKQPAPAFQDTSPSPELSSFTDKPASKIIPTREESLEHQIIIAELHRKPRALELTADRYHARIVVALRFHLKTKESDGIPGSLSAPPCVPSSTTPMNQHISFSDPSTLSDVQLGISTLFDTENSQLITTPFLATVNSNKSETRPSASSSACTSALSASDSSCPYDTPDSQVSDTNVGHHHANHNVRNSPLNFPTGINLLTGIGAQFPSDCFFFIPSEFETEME